MRLPLFFQITQKPDTDANKQLLCYQSLDVTNGQRQGNYLIMSDTSEIVDGINSKQQSSIEMCYCDCNKQNCRLPGNFFCKHVSRKEQCSHLFINLCCEVNAQRFNKTSSWIGRVKCLTKSKFTHLVVGKLKISIRKPFLEVVPNRD